MPPSPSFSSSRVVVSAGHCNPSLDQLKAAIDAGLSMVTHFGNGCPVELPSTTTSCSAFFCVNTFGLLYPRRGARRLLPLEVFEMGGARSFDQRPTLSRQPRSDRMHEISGFGVEVDEAELPAVPARTTWPVPPLRCRIFVTFLKNLSWMMEI